MTEMSKNSEGRLVQIYRETLFPRSANGWTGYGSAAEHRSERALPAGSKSVFSAIGGVDPGGEPTRGVFDKDLVVAEVKAGNAVLKRSFPAMLFRPNPTGYQ